MDPFQPEYEKIDKNDPILQLVKTLKRYSYFQGSNMLLETYFLNDFSKTTLFPSQIFSPRYIIKRMMEIHGACMDVIYKNPTFLKTIVYKHNSDEEVEEYTFSNNMAFYNDIITICYLYSVIIVNKINDQIANDLMAIMKRKYCIIDTNFGDMEMITLDRIIASYPSVSLSMVHYTTEKIYDSVYNYFPDLSSIFRSHWLAVVIPELNTDYKIPLALLLAIAVIVDKDNKLCYVLYQRILTIYSSEAFPKCFKIQLSVYWNIVYMTGTEYKYASYFTTVREKAINLIKYLRANDPSLAYTLSNI